MSEFGEIMAELRQDQNMTQKDLASILHMAASSISNYETGHRTPNADFIRQISDYFNVTSDYLLGRTSSNLSVELIETEYIDGLSVGRLIEKLLSLNEPRRRTICTLLDDLLFCAKVQERQ